jgi:methanogenic corrinoid protein MtbC1
MVKFDSPGSTKTLQDAILGLDENEANRLLDEKLAEGENPQKIVRDIRQSINLIGDKFIEGQLGIVELAMASRILQESLESLSSWYEGIVVSGVGRAIIGTIQSDREDISHELIAALLFGAGFDIYVIGGNASAELFVNRMKEISPDIVVLLGLDEDSIETILETINSIRKSEATAKLIVGPRIGMSYIFTIDEDLRKIISADAFLNDITEVGDLAADLIVERKETDV